MSDWQKTLRDDSISTLEQLRAYVAGRFGEEAAEREIDVEALRPAFDNFQMRITRESLDQIREVGDANWQQFIPTVQELEIVDGVIDSLDEEGDSPVPNITTGIPIARCSSSARCAPATAASAPAGGRSATRRRYRSRSTSRRSSTSPSIRRFATSSSRAATR